MTTSTDNIVHRLFAALGTSPDAFTAFFAEDGEIVAVRAGAHPDHPLYGTHRGAAAIRALLPAFGRLFEAQDFAIETVTETAERAWASGRFTYLVKPTGRIFASDWALRLDLEGGRIRTYHFYEDSEALAAALAA